MPQIDIRLDGDSRGSVVIDGVTVPNVHRVSFVAGSGQLTKVVIEILAYDVAIEALAETTIKIATNEILTGASTSIFENHDRLQS